MVRATKTLQVFVDGHAAPALKPDEGAAAGASLAVASLTAVFSRHEMQEMSRCGYFREI